MNIEWKLGTAITCGNYSLIPGVTETYYPCYEGNTICGCRIDARNHIFYAIVGHYMVYEGDNLTEAMLRVTRIISDLNLATNPPPDITVKPYTFGYTNRDIIGWKKAYVGAREVIVKLRIHKGTCCNITAMKCRAEKAKVIAAYYIDVTYPPSLGDPIDEHTTITPMIYYHNKAVFRAHPSSITYYHVGDELSVDIFGNMGAECAPGIHFFKDLEHAFRFRFL